MIESIEFRDFDSERYSNLERLFRGQLGPKGEGRVGPPGLFVLKRRGRVVKVRHTHSGRIDPESLGDLSSLREAARRLGVRWIVVVDGEALEAINEAASARLRLGHDMADMLYEVVAALGEQAEAGRVALWPNLFEGVRRPSRDALHRLRDTVLPPGGTFLLYIFEGSMLWAEIICVRGERELTLIAGHDALESGPPPKKWREDYKLLLAAASERFGPPTLGIFVSLEAAVDILSSQKGSGSLPKAMARRDLIFDPLPPWLAGPLGVMAVRDAVHIGRKAGERLAQRVKPKGLGAKIAGQVAGRVAERVKSSIADRLRGSAHFERVEQTVNTLRTKADLKEILGFDPFLLAGNLIDFAGKSDSTTDDS